MTKIRTYFATVAFLFCFFGIGTQVLADYSLWRHVDYAKTLNMSLPGAGVGLNNFQLDNDFIYNEGWYIADTSSSNTSVATVESTTNSWNARFNALKAGSTTLKVTYKNSSTGKTRVFTTKLKLFKYQNPIKQLKVNGKKIKVESTGNHFEATAMVTKGKGKAVLSLNKNWKVKSVVYEISEWNAKGERKIIRKKHKLKNLPVPKYEWEPYIVTISNTKTGVNEILRLYIKNAS